MTIDDNVRRLRNGRAAVGATGIQSANLGAVAGDPAKQRIFTDETKQYVYVRVDGSTDYTVVRYTDVPLEYDFEVQIGFLYGSTEMQIIGIDYQRRAASGKSAVLAGVGSHAPQHSFPVTPGQPPSGNKVKDPVFLGGHQINTLNITPSSGMIVKLLPGPLAFVSGWRWWKGQESSDLTALIPAGANDGCVVLVEIDSALTIFYTAGADFTLPANADMIAQNAPDPTAGRVSYGLILLTNGMTAIGWHHIMPLAWRAPSATGEFEASLSTADATVTNLIAYVVAELASVTIAGRVVAAKTDKTAGYGASFRVSFRRASGGNVTLVGAGWLEEEEDSGGAPAITFAVDTGAQTGIIEWTGVAAENWEVKASYTVVTV